MMYKVIFDTNIFYGAEVNSFFGSHARLNEFTKYCQIIIPDIVIEETRKLKESQLVSHREKFNNNYFSKKFLPNLKISQLRINEIKEEISKIESAVEFEYKTIFLTKPEGMLEKMKKLALANDPPFEKGSDKGFKDAYIYFTILEYMESKADETIFFITRDNKFKEAFNSHENIQVVKDYEEFEKHTIEQYHDDYFIGILEDKIGYKFITPKNMKNMWKNIDGQDILLLEIEDQSYVVKISDREILDVQDFTPIQDSKKTLIHSETFRNTHLAISTLQESIPYLSGADIKEILTACHENNQIRLIADDDDIKEFILEISVNNKDIVKAI